MLEFCKCGSIMNENQCSNKNCPHKVTASGSPVQKKAAKKTEPKSPKSRRNSKVITYNLYDIEEKEL